MAGSLGGWALMTDEAGFLDTEAVKRHPGTSGVHRSCELW